ncbi:hypothetical protein C8R47DRAFT_1327006, partial [Mycena vitilis]
MHHQPHPSPIPIEVVLDAFGQRVPPLLITMHVFEIFLLIASYPPRSPLSLLASLHKRSVHVTDVRSKDDLLLVSLSKAKRLKQVPDMQIPSVTRDQASLWQKPDLIDAFSIGATPYRLALEVGETVSPSSGMEETLPLLLTAVQDGRLTLDDIRVRLHDNPFHIFGLPDQTQTHVEVVIGRKTRFGQRATCWSPLER